MPAEREVFHFAALLVFQSVAGGVPLLPRPAFPSTSPSPSPSKEAGKDLSWAGALLNAVRGEISSEAEQCLSSLLSEIEVENYLFVCGPF